MTTENESRIHMLNEVVLYQSVGAFIQADKINYQSQHLYIISEDEIKEGDWCITGLRIIRKCKSVLYSNNNFKSINGYEFEDKTKDSRSSCKKIIATTDQSLLINISCNCCESYQNSNCNEKGDGIICYQKLPQPSKEWIDYYISEYNKGNIITDVLVEYEEIYSDYGETDIFDLVCTHHGKISRLKINRDKTINIKSVKENWDREEVKILLQKILLDKPKLEGLMMTCWENEWIEQNL